MTERGYIPSRDFEQDQLYMELVSLVTKVEGEYVNDPEDPGGPTNFGIAWNYNTGILKELGVSDVRQLTKDQARYIYYVKYWLTSGSHLIPDKKLSYIHFDIAVNGGIGAAAWCLMGLSKNPRFFEGNGKNAVLWWALFCEYIARRQRYYTTKCSKRLRERYLEGWINRLSTVISAVATTM